MVSRGESTMLTENTSTKRIEEAGWFFLPPNNFLSAEGTRPSILEDLQPAETEGLYIWKAWLLRPETEYEPLNEQPSEMSGAIQRIQLAEADTLIVLDAVINPAEPTADLVAAFRMHREEQE